MPIIPIKMGMPSGSSNISGQKIVDELKKLSGTDKLPASAIKDVVMSVNGKSGNVDVTLDSLDAQKKSQMLTDISSTTWGNSVLVATDPMGHMLPINYTEYSRQILSLKSKDELINNLGLKPGEYPVTSVNGKMGTITITAEDVGAAKTEHTHLIYEITGLLDELDSKLNVGESIPYSDLTGTPSIPDEQVNSDWLATSGKSEILNKPDLFDGDYNSLENKPQLFSGSFNDLADKPAIPAGQVNADWDSTSGVSRILNKPTLFSGDYRDLSNKPLLFSGSYADLSNKPVIPAGQIQSDWSQTVSTALDYIKNKPALFDGNYNSLTNRPTLFDGTWGSLTGKPNLSTVATSGSYADLTNKPSLFSGSYSDLTNKPTIPASQIQSDWNQTNASALDFIKNKPTIPSVAYPVNSVNGKTGTVTLTNADVGAAAATHNHAITDVTGLQAALDGKIATGANIPYSSITGKPTIPSNTSQITESGNLYYTDARVQSYLAANNYRKVETLQGTTNASGVYQVTFGNTYTTPPHVNPFIVNGTAAMIVTVSNITNTGCTVSVQQRNSVTLLNIEVLLAATIPVASAIVGVLVVSKT